jgi:acyl carrier protein
MNLATRQETGSQRFVLLTLAALATAGVFFAITPFHELAGVPSWAAYALLGSCIAVLAYLLYRIERDERARVEAVTAGGRSLTAQEFATQYFTGASVAVAARCHELFAQNYEYDASRISADDTLCQDLLFAAHDCLDAHEFLHNLESEFAIKFTEAEARDMRTMKDIVEAVLAHKRDDSAQQITGSNAG